MFHNNYNIIIEYYCNIIYMKIIYMGSFPIPKLFPLPYIFLYI